MSLTIDISSGAMPSPQIVPPGDVVQQAREAGNPHAEKALAVTRPFVRIDQTGLNYDTRTESGRREFRFSYGVLRLTLWQRIYIANDLSSCAQGIWAQHERDHVTDNRGLMGQMDRRIRSDRNLKTILFNPQWRPRDSFDRTQNRIQTCVADIFRQLTWAAVQARDTRAEYARIQRMILQTYPEPFYHKVERGESLSELARFYYGNGRFWPSIYNANKSVIGANPDLIHPGQQLLIPKRP